MSEALAPLMSDAERALFESFLARATRYVEFGSGGSTWLAARSVRDWVISVDSAEQWHDRVRAACVGAPVQPELIAADIGPTGAWGYPIDVATRPRWPQYHEAPWSLPKALDADLYFVDGRFRVACAAQVVLHAPPGAVLGIHDFASRRHYHVIFDIAREIARAGDLSFLLPRPEARTRAIALLEAHRFEPG